MRDTEPGWHDVKMRRKSTARNALRVLEVVRRLAGESDGRPVARYAILTGDLDSPEENSTRGAVRGQTSSRLGTGMTLSFLEWYGYVAVIGREGDGKGARAVEKAAWLYQIAPRGERFLQHYRLAPQ